MADATGRINTLQVRCPCGESFENAETYLEHKRLCGTHLKGRNVMSTISSSSRRAATVPARASIPASTPRPVASVACWCGSTFKNRDQLQRHGCHCAVYKQQRNTCSTTLDLIQVPELNSGADSVLAAGKKSIPPAGATAQKMLCPCGQSFTNESRLKGHLRYSKTHQTGKPRSGSTPKGTTPVLVPFTAPHSPPTSIPPALKPVPGIVPSSVLSVASPISCTYGHAFETQRVLELHKRDSSYHRRQADKSLTQNQQGSSLVSSFASLKLEPVLTQAGPLVAKFACMCGCTFTSQKALEQHKEEKRRFAWPEKGERSEKTFKTPRPKYQEDAYLRDICAALARQNCGGE